METIKAPLEIRQLQHIASDDPTRIMLGGVYCNGKLAVATDGHAMAIRKIPESAELPKNSILKFSTRNPNKLVKNSGFVVGQKFGDGWIAPLDNERIDSIDAQFPDYRMALPRADKMTDSITVSFNAELLLTLATALGAGKSNQVVLQIPKEGLGPILIITENWKATPEAFGLIMPMKMAGQTPLEIMTKVMAD